MKVFLLAVTILLLINRIRSTPRMLSKTLYKNNTQQAIDKAKKKIEDIDINEIDKEDILKITQSIVVVFAWLYSMLIIIYYILVGNRFSSNAIMLILTALQIVTMFIGTKMSLRDFNFVDLDNVNNNKFHRFWFLFNVLLDYVYYPMTIYLLLT